MDPKIFKNKLLIFEGADFTGKTSVSNYIYNDLIKNNLKVIKTQQPGGDWSPLSPLINSLCKDKRFNLGNYANLFAFLLDRSECIEKIIKPALDSGKTVICDRWSYSTIAYQLYGKGMLEDFKHFLKEDKKVEVMKEWIENSFFNIEPDFVFYFPERIGNREINNNDNFETRGEVFETRVRNAYEEMKDRLDWIEVHPGGTVEDTVTNLYNRVEVRLELI